MEQPPLDYITLPSELWEAIILRVPPSDVPPMRLLNREFRELIDNSPTIKYHLDLFSVGLEESGAGGALAIQDRRQKLEVYYSRWERFNCTKPILLAKPPFPNVLKAYVDKGFLIYEEDAGGGTENIYFVRLPSSAMEIPQKEWTVRGLPISTARGHHPAIHPPSDLLAVPILSEDETSFHVDLFRMSDGQPYANNIQQSVMKSSYEPLTRIVWAHLQLTSCRLAARVVTIPADDLLDPGTTDLYIWDWRTGKLWLEHTRTRALTAHFIDEYRLFGTVCPGRKTVLMLWDSSKLCNPKDPPGIIFEPGPNYVYSNVDRHTRNHEMNHVLPFRESPSMGITAFVAYTESHITRMMIRRLLIIPVETLAAFSCRIGEDTTYVPWQDWLHFATPIELPQDSTHTHILHSHVLNVHEASTAVSTSILRVWDFSLRSRRRQVKNDPSAPIPPYTIREFPFNADCRDSAFDFTEGGVLATSVRAHVILGCAKVLTYVLPGYGGRKALLDTLKSISALINEFQAFSYIFTDSIVINPSSLPAATYPSSAFTEHRLMCTVANPRFHLLSLPAEIVENVVLYLPTLVMLRLRIVGVSCRAQIFGFITDFRSSQLNRRICDLIDMSPTIQYRIELLAASLIDDSRESPFVVADRRALLERYHSRWGRLQGDKWRRVALPTHTTRVLEEDVLGCVTETGGGELDVHFIQLPSVSREVRLKRWIIRGLPKCDAALKINPGVDLLVVPEVVNEGRTFRIRTLRLSNGFPHPSAPIDTVMHYKSSKILSNLEISVSGHRLVAIATLRGAFYFGRRNTLIVWDWRSGRRVLKTSRCWVDQLQFIDDYRVIAITRPKEQSTRRSLVVWDTTATKGRRLILEMPSRKADVVYKPKSLVDHIWAPTGKGLHRSDPTKRAIGILCRRTRGKVDESDDYMIVINAADVCTHTFRKSRMTTRIPWRTWERSATAIQFALSVTKATALCGSQLFAMTKGLSGWNFLELLRVYDFSTGTRNGRNPDRPPVRDILLNLGRGVVDRGEKIWCFSEDSLLLFHTPSPNGRVSLLLWAL